MNQSESKQPIFEEYPVVSCEDCKSYWSEQCDGTPVGSERLCKAFKATRRTDSLFKLNRFRKPLNSLQEDCLW